MRASPTAVPALALAVALGACSQVPAELDPTRGFAEPAAPERVAQGPVDYKALRDAPFPNLASVPTERPQTTTHAERQAALSELTDARGAARYAGQSAAAGAAHDGTAVPPSAPPPPAIAARAASPRIPPPRPPETQPESRAPTPVSSPTTEPATPVPEASTRSLPEAGSALPPPPDLLEGRPAIPPAERPEPTETPPAAASPPGAPALAAQLPAQGEMAVLPEPGRIVFAPGSASLSEAARETLERFARELPADRAVRVELRGYAAGASAPAARRLSLARVIAVRDFLEAHGVAPGRLIVRALGPASGDEPGERVDLVPAR
ncbi:MAG TPA: OmpA family protein [Kiloniellales bacterium]|nr:OmpA family protein [Kiloniellales bacterium]